MIVKTFKVRKKGLVICGGILIALLVILVVCGIVHKATAKTYSMKTESERQKFMSDMGWEVSEEYTSCKVISIPKEFNDTYESYNELQKEQGFNLKKYKGEMVEIYTYQVYNYPGKSDNVVINLIAFEGKLIGGDVSCNELDGFMQGLKNPNPSDKNVTEKKISDDESSSENTDSDSSETESKEIKKNKKENSSLDESSKSDNSDKKQSQNTFDSSSTEENNSQSDSEQDNTNLSDSSVTEESSIEYSENTSATENNAE